MLTRAVVLATLAVALSVTTLAQSKSPIEGVWRVSEVQVIGGQNPGTQSSPQPGYYIFTRGHYSITTIGGAKPRTTIPQAQSQGTLTDAQKIALDDHWGPFTANAGTYAIKGTTLTTKPLVAKNEGVMQGPGQTREFKIEGSTLWLICQARGRTDRRGDSNQADTGRIGPPGCRVNMRTTAIVSKLFVVAILLSPVPGDAQITLRPGLYEMEIDFGIPAAGSNAVLDAAGIKKEGDKRRERVTAEDLKDAGDLFEADDGRDGRRELQGVRRQAKQQLDVVCDDVRRRWRANDLEHRHDVRPRLVLERVEGEKLGRDGVFGKGQREKSRGLQEVAPRGQESLMFTGCRSQQPLPCWRSRPLAPSQDSRPI